MPSGHAPARLIRRQDMPQLLLFFVAMIATRLRRFLIRAHRWRLMPRAAMPNAFRRRMTRSLMTSARTLGSLLAMILLLASKSHAWPAGARQDADSTRIAAIEGRQSLHFISRAARESPAFRPRRERADARRRAIYQLL